MRRVGCVVTKNEEVLQRTSDSTTSEDTARSRSVDAVVALQRASVERGLETLTDEDIAAEIATVRAERSR